MTHSNEAALHQSRDPLLGGGDGLLPCPGCGGIAQLSREYDDCDGNPAVECIDCNMLSWTPADWNRRLASPPSGAVPEPNEWIVSSDGPSQSFSNRATANEHAMLLRRSGKEVSITPVYRWPRQSIAASTTSDSGGLGREDKP